MNKLLKKLCTTCSISGNEQQVRDIIISEIKDHVESFHVDKLGNIIAFKKGKQPAKTKLMISCHMDEVGFIVTDIDDEGLIKFTSVGGVNPTSAVCTSVMIGEKNIPGVIGCKPIHLLSDDEKKEKIKYSDLFIDIGAKNKKQAEKHIRIGDFISFTGDFQITPSDTDDITKCMIRAKALDDRIGCYILIDMIKEEIDYDMYFVFAVQEEVGLRGATTAAFAVNPDAALVIEATTAADLAGVSQNKTICSLGDGPVISFMDSATLYDRDLFDLALNISKQEKIKSQIKRGTTGGNDAGAIHKSRDGVKTLAISLPCRYLHSQICQIHGKDVINTQKLLRSMATKIAGGKNFE